jgi:hypothetical protein
MTTPLDVPAAVEWNRAERSARLALGLIKWQPAALVVLVAWLPVAEELKPSLYFDTLPTLAIPVALASAFGATIVIHARRARFSAAMAAGVTVAIVPPAFLFTLLACPFDYGTYMARCCGALCDTRLRDALMFLGPVVGLATSLAALITGPPTRPLRGTSHAALADALARTLIRHDAYRFRYRLAHKALRILGVPLFTLYAMTF